MATKTVVEYYGAGHPQEGQVSATYDVEVAGPEKPFNGSDEFAASIKRRANKLSRKGDYAAASYLLSKHGL